MARHRHHRILLLAGALLITVGVGRGLAQQMWFPAGDALSDDNGAWHFFMRTVSTNLVEEGLTYLRVTSGPCDGSTSAYAVYEANMVRPPTDDDAWYGTLEPVGAGATALRQSLDTPNAYIIPKGLESEVTVALEGVRPSITFTACFRAPN